MNIQHNEEGFSLVELMIALAIIGLLIAIGLPAWLGLRNQGQDTEVKENLVAAAKLQGALASIGDYGRGFVADVAVLELEEPALSFGSLTDEEIHVAVADVVAASGDNGQVLMYAKSGSGTWFGIRMVLTGGLAGRHTCSGPDVTDVNDIAACVGETW